jgi:hypothetical protein
MQTAQIQQITTLLSTSPNPLDDMWTIDWIPHVLGPWMIEDKIRLVLDGLGPDREALFLRCKEAEVNILAHSRLLAAVIIAHPHKKEVETFCIRMDDHLKHFLPKSSTAPLRHALILGLMRATVIVHRFSDNDLWGYSFEIPLKWISTWVYENAAKPLTNVAATELGNLIIEFQKAMGGHRHSLGYRLRDQMKATTQRSESQKAFVRSYCHKYLDWLNETEMLVALFPRPDHGREEGSEI